MFTKELTDYLAQQYVCVNTLKDCFLSGIESGSHPMNQSNLFITDESSIPSDSGSVCMLILCRKSIPSTLRSNSIYICTRKPVHEICLLLCQWQNERNRINEFKMQMYRTLDEKQYLDVLLDFAFAYLENPLLVMDHTYHLINFRKTSLPLPSPWQTLISTGIYDSAYMNDSFYEGQLKSLHSREAIRFVLEECTDYVCSVFCRDTFMGSVSLLESNRPVSEYDLEILKTLSDIIGIKLGQATVYPHGTEYQYSQIMIDLLNNRISSENDLKFRMHTHKWTPRHRNRIFLFCSKINDANLLNNIQKSFRTLYPCYKNILFNNYLVVLAETNLDGEMVPAFDDFCIHYNVQTGISEIFDNLLDMQIYYLQAETALRYGRNRSPAELFYYYHDYILENIAEHLCQTASYRQFCHPAVMQLLEYDREHHSDFSETFYTYIEQNRSVGKTSQILHQHKNTVNYRIQRIKEISGLDLTDFKELTHIYLTYKLLFVQNDSAFHKA